VDRQVPNSSAKFSIGLRPGHEIRPLNPRVSSPAQKRFLMGGPPSRMKPRPPRFKLQGLLSCPSFRRRLQSLSGFRRPTLDQPGLSVIFPALPPGNWPLGRLPPTEGWRLGLPGWLGRSRVNRASGHRLEFYDTKRACRFCSKKEPDGGQK